MADELDAYNELETIGIKALAECGVSFFGDLASDKQNELLAIQEQVFLKHQVTKDNFINPTPFIALD